jgi:hypothetical protein
MCFVDYIVFIIHYFITYAKQTSRTCLTQILLFLFLEMSYQ